MKLADYIQEFNRQDAEIYKTDINNSGAYNWLLEEIPKFECSDKQLEKTYYYRWWVYRKHLKSTPNGFIITEFLPNVCWAGDYNVINAAAGHHIAEGRWLKNADKYLWDYIDLFLQNQKEGTRYSSWLIWSAQDLYNVTGNINIKNFFKKCQNHYKVLEETHLTKSGLFWSTDDRDAMEYSVSGRINGVKIKGVRPTLNSYMYGNASALYSLSKALGTPLKEYKEKAENLKNLINKNLWREGFYKAIHTKSEEYGDIAKIDTRSCPKEQIGYIPWYFGLPGKEKSAVFDYLTNSKIFFAKEGITTVEQTCNEFLAEHDHECLWNGYVWPFATSQTLTAMLRAMQNSTLSTKNYAENFYKLLSQYACMHYRIDQNGKKIMWIDEVLKPYSHDWSSRTILESKGWPQNLGGKERGKDYNHSSFCDIVISALCGITFINGELSFKPIIPKELEYYRFDDIYIKGERYTFVYDKTGNHYGKQGFFATKNGKEII